MENTGKVTFAFKVLTDQIVRKGLVEVSPQAGKVAGGEKQRFSLRVCPGFPDSIHELIQIECGYFEPVDLIITGTGIFPSILTTLNRQHNVLFKKNFEKEKKRRTEEE